MLAGGAVAKTKGTLLLIESTDLNTRLNDAAHQAGYATAVHFPDRPARLLAEIRQGRVDAVCIRFEYEDGYGGTLAAWLLERAPDIPLVVHSADASTAGGPLAKRLGLTTDVLDTARLAVSFEGMDALISRAQARREWERHCDALRVTDQIIFSGIYVTTPMDLPKYLLAMERIITMESIRADGVDGAARCLGFREGAFRERLRSRFGLSACDYPETRREPPLPPAAEGPGRVLIIDDREDDALSEGIVTVVEALGIAVRRRVPIEDVVQFVLDERIDLLLARLGFKGGLVSAYAWAVKRALRWLPIGLYTASPTARTEIPLIQLGLRDDLLVKEYLAKHLRDGMLRAGTDLSRTTRDLDDWFRRVTHGPAPASPPPKTDGLELRQFLLDVRDAVVDVTYLRCGRSVSATARELGLGPTTLRSWIQARSKGIP